jgi:tetratricopeptide (TPR) repeat protein
VESQRAGLQLAALGYRALEAERYEDAAKFYQNAIDVDKGEASHWYNMGLSLTKMRHFRKALPFFEQAAKLAPNEAEHKQALVWCQDMVGKIKDVEEKNAERKAKEKESPPK